MSHKIDDTPKRLDSEVAAATGSKPVNFDPTGGIARLLLTRITEECLDIGLVVRSGVSAYDCTVKIGPDEVACKILSNQVNTGSGVAECDIPMEGTYVLVYRRHSNKKVGTIIGAIPPAWHLKPEKPPNMMKCPPVSPMEDMDAFQDNSAYKSPYTGKENSDVLMSCANRSRNVMPGEKAVKNENNCGYCISAYGMEVTAGASFIRVDRMDDEIWMRSTDYRRWSNETAEHEFNDAGLISAEGRNYSYQGELLGDKGRKLPSKMEGYPETHEKEPRPRTRWWRGFLGNLFSWFAIRPRENKDEDDQGLASVHVSQAGKVSVRAAGGVSLERYDAIPVPRRLKDAWDPEGDKELDTNHEGFKPFNNEDPHAMGLAKSSEMAWSQKTAYQRFDELKKDFKTQQESEVKELEDDDDDPFNSKEENFKEYKGRKAGVYCGDDGSVIIRDAWGSEIVMVGGNICINTPGNILMNANRNIVSVAGEGVATRGVKCADFTSDEGHVHIQAPKTVQIAGGSDKSPGGVLIESLADSPAVAASEEAGDAAMIGGVVIRAEKSAVSVSGKKSYLTGLDDIYIVGGDDGDTRDGNVIINGKNTIMTASDIAAMVIETSSCLVTKDSVIVGSDKGSVLVAGKSTAVFSGKQVPVMWAPVDDSPDLSKIKNIWKTFQKSNIITPYNWQNLVKNALFSFRKSVDAMTSTGIEPWRPNKNFSVYEPYWQVMKELGVKTVEAKPVAPRPEEVHKSKCWPGKDAFNTGRFISVSAGSLNIEGENAVSKNRDSVKDKISVTEKSYSEFQV